MPQVQGCRTGLYPEPPWSSPPVLPGAAATGFPAACGPEATGTGVLAADVVWPDVDTPVGWPAAASAGDRSVALESFLSASLPAVSSVAT